jgi:hypothetical protein
MFNKLKSSFSLIFVLFIGAAMMNSTSCEGNTGKSGKTATQEQVHTEQNQAALNAAQPAPYIDWSLERDNLIKRFSLMNDRSVQMYIYVFNHGAASPIGYWLINKVSSVNSQLTNPSQIVVNSTFESGNYSVIESPAEDGSYGSNGNGIFGFTPDGLYLETNMNYIVSTAPLSLAAPYLGEVTVDVGNALKAKLQEIETKTYGKPLQ